MSVVLDHDFLVFEVNINGRTKLIAVQKAHPSLYIRVIAEAMGTVHLIVHGLSADLKCSCDLRNTFPCCCIATI